MNLTQKHDLFYVLTQSNKKQLKRIFSSTIGRGKSKKKGERRN